MSKEAIVEKILSDASIRAESFVLEQSERADDILADVAEQCKTYIYAFKAETEKMTADIESRAKTVAELDAKKLLLATKTKLLDEVFARAVNKLASLDKAQSKKLLLGMLGVAEDGDTVILGERQKGCLTKGDIDALAKERGIKLALSDKTGDFDGMILRGNGVDKNLTYAVEVALLREEIETQIAKEIFN